MEIIPDINYEKLLRASLANGGDFSEIYVERITGTSIISEAKRIEKYLAIEEFGVGIRVVIDDMAAYAYTNDLTCLDELASSVAAAMKTRAFSNSICLEKNPLISSAVLKREPDKVNSSDKIEFIQRAQKAAWDLDRSVVQVKIHYTDSKKTILIANSNGYISQDNRSSIIFAVQGVVSQNSLMETGYEQIGGARGFEILEENPPEEIALKALKRALLTLHADKARGGQMPVVLSSQAGGTMVHEAIGHGLEADLAGEGLSVYSGRIGEQVASKAITVIDDGTLKGLRGSAGYDDEGIRSSHTILVENGILKTYLTDLITSKKYDLPLTGNGRRESYRHKPIPRMTNTLIRPGNLNPDDILSKVDSGIFVKKMGGGQVNPANGDFVFEVSEGYSISKGQIAEPIRGATLIGNGPQILLSIEDVGSDLGFGIGTCGKDGQGVPVADAQPTLLIPLITIGGAVHEK